MNLDNECLRCLRYIAKSSAQLEEPLKKVELQLLLDRGLIKISRRFQSSWGGKMHNCVELYATDKGRQELEQANDWSMR